MKIWVAVVGLALFSSAAFATDYKALLNGKYLLMPDAGCAGIEFSKDGSAATLYGELGCTTAGGVGLDTRVKWISPRVFILIEKNRLDEQSPPKSYVYVVEAIRGKHVMLKSVWTGWGNYADDTTRYTITR